MARTKKNHADKPTIPQALSEADLAKTAKQLAETQGELERFRDLAREEKRRLREKEGVLKADISNLAEQVRTGHKTIAAQRDAFEQE